MLAAQNAHDQELPWSFDVLNVAAIQMPLLLVIVVHCIHNILLAILEMLKVNKGFNFLKSASCVP